MGGSEVRGEYHLIIESVRLEDDAEYQCQVGPSGGDPALLGIASLSVMGKELAYNVVDDYMYTL